jgi:putative redox protein
MHTASVKWKEGLTFDTHIGEHRFAIDSGMMGANQGPGPKKLLLASLAGCTAMDVVSLLNKMRVPFDRLEVEVEGDLTNEHPKVYSELRMVYKLWGENIKEDKVEKAVKMSKEKYCGVSAMLEKACTIRYRIEYL